MSLTVWRHPLLPTQEVVFASNILTRQEVRIATGNMIHSFKLNNALYVSNELYAKMNRWYN